MSLYHNVKQGNWGMAALDTVGVVADAVALALPVIPGGAGAAIKASRAAKMGIDALQTADQAINVGQGAAQAVDEYQQGNTGWSAFYGGMAALGVRGAAAKGGELSKDIRNLSEAEKAGVKLEAHSGDLAAPAAKQSAPETAQPLDNAVKPRPQSVDVPTTRAAAGGGPGPSERHAAWASDPSAIGGSMAQLGKRALQKSGGDWVKSEQLFEGYLQGVSRRLERTGSRYGVEIQPAALPGGQRVDNFIWHEKLDGSGLVHDRWGNLALFPYPGSRRLDAGLIDLQSPDRLKNVVAGFDITLNKKKPDRAGYYLDAFPGMRRFWDVRLEGGR